jgi:hypothetical protein
MVDKKKKKPTSEEAAAPPPGAEVNNEDFQFVLKALLAAYESILEQQLNLAKNPAELEKEAESRPPNAKDELAQANRIFEKFLTEEVALRMIPSETRHHLGPIENWRWVLAAPALLFCVWMAGLSRAANLPRVELLPVRVLALCPGDGGAAGSVSSDCGRSPRFPIPGGSAGRCI